MANIINLDMIYDYHWNSPIVPSDWERLPFKNFATRYDDIIQHFQLGDDEICQISAKIENTCRKILMMYHGGQQTLEYEYEFMSTQNRRMPILIWDSEIRLLYHLEAMILFGRSALDIFTYVLTRLLLNSRMDSFNSFRKTLLTDIEPKLLPLKEIILSNQSDETSWLNIVCSNEQLRSVRDTITHQTTARIEYYTTDSKSDREYCHVEINGKAILLDNFINEICEGVFQFCISAEDIIINECK
ncbi:MAG TPA: hypothetical protein C5S50_02360 [Methanosarcinaceae archaeon]|nr:hypothetical protein [Methanosarcinaceae archaeon]